MTFELLEHLIAFLGIEQNGSPDNDRWQNSFSDPIPDLGRVHLLCLRVRDHSGCFLDHRKDGRVLCDVREHYIIDKVETTKILLEADFCDNGRNRRNRRPNAAQTLTEEPQESAATPASFVLRTWAGADDSDPTSPDYGHRSGSCEKFGKQPPPVEPRSIGQDPIFDRSEMGSQTQDLDGERHPG